MNRLLLIPCLVLAFSSSVLAQEKEERGRERLEPVIRVKGHATLDLPAERVQFVISVFGEGAEPQQAIDENAERVRRVMDALVGAGLDEGEIETGPMMVEPLNMSAGVEPGVQPVIAGHRSRRSLIIETAKLDLTGALLQASVDAGGSQIESMEFTLSDPHEASATALRAAVAIARSDAETIADGLGVQIGRILSAERPELSFEQTQVLWLRGPQAGHWSEAPYSVPGYVHTSASIYIEFEIDQSK